MKKVLFLTTLTLIASLVFAYNTDEGKTIFSTRCTACHAIDKSVVGPALMNVDQRHEEKWIIAFVHSSQTLVKSGDTAAVNLFQKFNSTVMPDHTDLTDEQIKSIISYIKDESKTIAAKPKSTIQRPIELQASYTPIKFTDYTFWLTLLSSIGLLVWALLMRVKIEGLK
jgi:cytochrome c2